MDKWAVATKHQAGWALYEDAAEVTAGEYGRRTESRCVTPCLLDSIICVSSHESVEQLPKERPMQDCTGLTSDQI